MENNKNNNKIVKLVQELFYRFLIIYGYFMSYVTSRMKKCVNFNIGFIVEEFFHKDLRGFGGFGKTVQNISAHYNLNEGYFRAKVLIPQKLPISPTATIKRFHNADVLFRANSGNNYILKYLKYITLVNLSKVKLFITIDYYPSYEYPLFASASTPLIVWIKDPRSKEEWEKLASVSSVLQMRKKKNKEELMKLAKQKEMSIKRVMKLSNILKRKIIFVTQAIFLIERARRTYGLNELRAHFLPNAIFYPHIKEFKYSRRPSLFFLGRLDPVKRPWIAFEMARRFKDIDFYIAGSTHVPGIMNPIIGKYRSYANIKFLDLIDDRQKKEILTHCWGIINTSVHEALPVSFLESFAFGKCVISCQNPDNLTEKFGFYTGELLGEGYDNYTLDKFSEKIEELLTNKNERVEKGRLARAYVEKNHSFANFERQLRRILFLERIV